MDTSTLLPVKRFSLNSIVRQIESCGNFCIAVIGCLAILFVNTNISSAYAADVTINVNSQKQVIDGYGASSAWSGAMSDKIFDGLYTNLGYSILRLRIEDAIGDNWKNGNFSSWSAELSNAKKAKARGAIVFASPWSPPKSLQESFTHASDKTNPFRLNLTKYQDYLDYLNAYAKYFKDNNAELYAISIQNEPDYADGWCWWTPTEMLNFVKNYAGKINSKVIAPESFQFLKNMSDPILNDPTALENIDILGYHIYGTSVANFAYPLFQQKAVPLGKHLWQTEHYVNENDNISTIMSIAKEIHDIMVTGNANAYVYWWIPHANGLTSTAGDLYKRAYVIGQFSKYIRPGYYRVDATATPVSNVYVSAYSGSNKIVIVAVNNTTSAVNQKFTLQNAAVEQFATYQTSSSANMAAGANVSVTSNSFTFSLPAQSITTFVGTNTSVSVTQPKRSFAQHGFKAYHANNSIVIIPENKLTSYKATIRSLDGKVVAAAIPVSGAYNVPVRAKATYLVEIEIDGNSLVQKIPVF